MAPVSKEKVSPLPVVITPADNKKTTTTTTPSAVVVCLWAYANAFVFLVSVIAKLILNLYFSCTKSTWLFRCVRLTDAAAAEVVRLRFGEVFCSTAAGLAAAAALPMLLTTTDTTTTSRRRGAVDALAWVALAATAGTHGMKIDYDRILLAAADAGDTNIFFDVVLGYILVAVDLLLAGVLLCCSPRRLELGEQKGDDDGVVV